MEALILIFVFGVLITLFFVNRNKRKIREAKKSGQQVQGDYPAQYQQPEQMKQMYPTPRPGIDGIDRINYLDPSVIPDNFIVLDLETTGLSAQYDEIVEISILKYEHGELVDTHHTLVNPGKPIPRDAIAVHGITDFLVKEAPRLEGIIDRLESHIRNAEIIVGYNISFDLQFISSALGRFGRSIPSIDAIDVLRYIRVSYPELMSRKLETMKEYFNINMESHRASDDCMVTVEVWKRALAETEQRKHDELEMMELVYKTLTENERQFIDALKVQMGEQAAALQYNIMSDKTINFCVGNTQIGRLKLSGRKHKMQILNRDNVIWLDITGGLDEAINNIKHWMKYVKSLK
ncbi:3'-5' exonuclease [Paenibacillus glycanilyticus]|uniref:3'-5' exonuclease n=1 Tax=Paenibacillus glycanilyticus TaxID=126569 RepID=UPI00203D85F0|nr:3'-5' exonuclease [Paenibacillus glycanilyticus]MCM3628784.1 3'-5' exonuclease [Paenibacillus glycanilyticus]